MQEDIINRKHETTNSESTTEFESNELKSECPNAGGLAITTKWFGIFSLLFFYVFLGIFLAIIAIVLSIIGFSIDSNPSEKKTRGLMFGRWAGIISIALHVFFTIIYFLTINEV